MNYLPILFIFFSFLLGGINYGGENNNKLPFRIKYKLPLKLVSHDHFDKYDFSEYIADQDIMQLKQYHNMTKSMAKKIIEDRKFFIHTSFSSQVSPYPEKLSDSIGCPENLKPKPIEDTVSVRIDYKLFATQNLVYGNCNLPDNYYYCAYSLFFCPEKKEFYELKIFTPIKAPSFNYDELISSLKCED